ncbi:PAB-dependent poly(A)-specific ribonuclease subunit PAN2 [Podospora fimiseda]|uniref:PAN2-PAN3 deadenylation complex catalytic subunit PAN2 n=1 Tax=Podospora fimiseda TaxID=252190 RepID=A0AAN7BU37_9PEZI|nr:PAB-dependent poly(A)-specific ribonuclease subunit PAN2 [Podospora fimiseda]
MDADWVEVSRITFPAPPPPPSPNNNPLHVGGYNHQPATALAFDTCAELLWAGDVRGRVASFCTRELQRYTAFKLPTIPTGCAVRQFLFHDKGVIVLGLRCVYMASRRGLFLWNIQHDGMQNLQCMSFTSKGASEIIVAGWQGLMFVIDVNKGEIVKEIPTDHYYSIMKKSRSNICAATNKGCVNLLDPVSFKVVKQWQAHASCINDMDAKGDFIVTCGGHNKQQSSSVTLDSYVNVFDLRNMVSMKPISFPPLAAYVRLHPRMLTTTIVTSQLGQMHVVDLMNPSSTNNVRYANITTFIALFDIAPSARALAIADDSAIHLWGSPNDNINFTDMTPPLVFPDPEDPSPAIDWSMDKPLSLVGMPFYRDTLFSAWPVDIISDMSAPPMRFDQSYLSTLHQSEWGCYGKNTKKLRRNYIEDIHSKTPSTTRPKFLSEKARESVMSPGQDQAEDASYDQTSASLDPSTPHKIQSLERKPPQMYSLHEIMYSKFGVDDFDFGYYNKTNYSGLQNQIPNSYANALLQLLHYTPLIRNMALQHTATACQAELCLLCEMGFVFDMLQKAEGVAVHATNMFRAIAADDRAQSLGLVEPDDSQQSLATPARPSQPHVPNVSVQNLARLLMDRIGTGYKSTQPVSTELEEDLFNLSSPADLEVIIQRLLSTGGTSKITCLNCREDTTRLGSVSINDLIYPPQKQSSAAGPAGPIPSRGAGGGVNNKGPKITFSQVLKMGVERENTNKGWCAKCRRYQNLNLRKTIHNVPAVLIINTAIMSPEHKKVWETPKFLPEEIGVIVKDGQFFCFEGEDLKTHLMRGAHNITVYSLIGMVVNIEHKPPKIPHLVGLVNVAHSEEEGRDNNASARWHLFNDFAVRPVSTEEALTFNAEWKMPSVIMYQIKAACGRGQNDSWRRGLDTSILFRDYARSSAAGSGGGGSSEEQQEEEKSYEVLDEETERPGPDTVFAIDTEYVSLKKELLLVTSKGDKETIRPAWLALGRVSLVRAGGEREGVAFVDDWINIREEVVDYLTEFSGISREDLDPRTCGRTRSLVPLKVAYKRLWVLLNLGCKFLGHGLRTDFRVINIYVPKEQVIDTSLLFHLKERLRWLGLALLADIVFGIKIQKGGKGHDSIEDARMSLKLFRKWEEWEDAGILNGELIRIYNEGKKRQYKANKEDDGVGGVAGASSVAGSSAALIPPVGTPVRIGTPTTVLVEGMGGLGLGLGVVGGVGQQQHQPTTPVREYPPGFPLIPSTGIGSRAAANGSPLPR